MPLEYVVGFGIVIGEQFNPTKILAAILVMTRLMINVFGGKLSTFIAALNNRFYKNKISHLFLIDNYTHFA